MRTIQRDIVGTFIFSSDHKILLGKNGKGGVYQDMWVVPGGGIEAGETRLQAGRREALEEVGIDIAPFKVEEFDQTFTGKGQKTLRDTGETVFVEMSFYDLIVHANKPASELTPRCDDDLIDAAWHDVSALPSLKLSPSMKATLQALGYLAPKYKAIIFDFYGVFCTDISLAWLREAVPNYGPLLPDFHKLCDDSARGTITPAQFHEKLAALTGIPREDIITGMGSKVAINRPLIDLARKLQKHYKIALLSNATRDWLDKLASEHGFYELFDEMVLSGDVGMIKPEREIFEHTLDRLAVQASEAIFIDDRPQNVDAAESYGIRSLLFVDTPTLVTELHALGVNA